MNTPITKISKINSILEIGGYVLGFIVPLYLYKIILFSFSFFFKATFASEVDYISGSWTPAKQ